MSSTTTMLNHQDKLESFIHGGLIKSFMKFNNNSNRPNLLILIISSTTAIHLAMLNYRHSPESLINRALIE